MWFRIMPRQTKMTQQCKQQAQTLKLKLESFGKQLPMPNLEYIAILWEYHQLYNYEASPFYIYSRTYDVYLKPQTLRSH